MGQMFLMVQKTVKPLAVVVVVRPFEEESHLEIHLKEWL